MASSSSSPTSSSTSPSYPSTLLGTYTPTPLLKVHYGPSSLPTHLIPSIRFLLAKRQGCKEEDVKAKVMIVTGRSLKEKTPVVKDVEGLLRREGMYGLTFSDIAQHAPIKDIQVAKQLAMDNEIDLLLSIGGGSPIDSTKAISHFVKEATGSEGFLPHIAVPTTLSVAETTQNAGYTSKEGHKVGVNHPALPPSIIIYDPLITLHTPLHLFLSTGVRALDHAVETLYRPKVPKAIKDMALWSVNGLMKGLKECKSLSEARGKGEALGEREVVVRTKLMVDAWESLFPLSSVGALGLSHALGHAFGATYSIPHGMCSCLTLGVTVRHLAAHLTGSDLDYLSMAIAFVPHEFLPLGDERRYTIEDVQGMQVDEKRRVAGMVGRSIELFLESVGLGTRLSEWEVPRRDLEGIGGAIVDRLGGYEMSEQTFKGVVDDVLHELAFDLESTTTAKETVPSSSKQAGRRLYKPGHNEETDRFPLGTRASQLALIQAHHVAEVLDGLHPHAGYSFPVTPMSVAGDRNKKDPLYLLTNQQAGTGHSPLLAQPMPAQTQIAKSLWTEELEEALMEHKLDVIVHCLKDMPTQLPDHCEIGAILPRENPHDALVVKKGLKYERLSDLPEGAVVGTSSVRRIAQIRKMYPGLKVMDIRGNLDTRLRKLDDPNGPFTAIILAAAGMNRMGWQDRITSIMRSPEILYAVGQGALALEIRTGDSRVKDVLRGAGDWKAEWSTGSERGLLRELEGGCSVPVGVEAWIEEVGEGSVEALRTTRGPFEGSEPGEEEFAPTAPLLHQSGGKGKLVVLHMTACVTLMDGKRQVMHDAGKVLIKSFLEAERWGHLVARELMSKGGKEILDEINVVRKQREMGIVSP